MYKCEICGATFNVGRIKSNHVRWKHLDNSVSIERIKNAKRKSDNIRYGRIKQYSIECLNCSKQFIIQSRQPKIKRKFCSRGCSVSYHNKGKLCSDATKKKISLRLKGKPISEEAKRKLSLVFRNRKFSEYSLQKMREAKLGKVVPAFNPTACQKIDEYGKQNGYAFQHAENGGEIKIIGYSLDGYDLGKNVVFEYQEKPHLKTKKRDGIRRRRIMKHLGCKYIEMWFDGNIIIYE